MIVQTDHSSLCHLPNQLSVNRRIWKWVSVLQGYDIEIRYIPGKVNPANTLTRQAWVGDAGTVAKVKDINREWVKMIRVIESATDDDIQAKLRELYCRDEEREKRQQVQDTILSKINSMEDAVVLSVAASHVNLSNEFGERLVRGILANEDYIDIFETLQDPTQTNEVTERGRTYKMKRGILKTHEENQSSTYEYW